MASDGATAFTRTPCGAASMAARPGERHDAGLGRRVVRLAGLGPPAEHRRVVDDHAAAAARTCGAASARSAAHRPGERDVEHPVPLLVGHVDELGGAAEPGVVHDHVEAAVLGDGAVDHRLHLVLDGDVAHQRERPRAAGQLGAARRPPRRAAARGRRSARRWRPPRGSAARWRCRCRCPAAAVTSTTLPRQQLAPRRRRRRAHDVHPRACVAIVVWCHDRTQAAGGAGAWRRGAGQAR